MSGSLTLPGGSEVFSFLTAATDEGFILNQAAIESEPIETPGVDGQRWRALRLAHAVFNVSTLVACASFSDAIILGKNYRKARHRNCSLAITAGGSSYTFKNIHVEEVLPTPRRGEIVGASASSGNGAHVLARWTFRPTEFLASDTVSVDEP